MEWRRYIVHADLNHCYAQIEEMKDPHLRDIAMAVGGNEEKRHGIILAKNDKARLYGIKTGESLREAYRKCPELYVIKPHYEEYIYYTSKVKDIYRRYTDKVESFGLDEAWFDLTDTKKLFGDPLKLARKIQMEVYEEYGLTVSMGISFNKIFAKLGSDMDKKMGFTIIAPDDFKEKIYGLAVDDLLYVGKATKKKLEERGIMTIGDLAHRDIHYLKSILGKNGEMLWYFASGHEYSEVKDVSYTRTVKSISNGVTAIRDLRTIDDIRMILWNLAESVASRLKDIAKLGFTVYLALRDKDLSYITRQKKIPFATDIASEIFGAAMELVYMNVRIYKSGELENHYRSITLGISDLIMKPSYIEDDFFGESAKREKERKIDKAMDEIRSKYGFSKVKRLVAELDEELTDFDPKGDHIIHPESWF